MFGNEMISMNNKHHFLKKTDIYLSINSVNVTQF